MSCFISDKTYTLQTKSTENFQAHEIVTPIRVNDAGDKLPASAHFKRKKRSAGATGNDSDDWASPHVHYKITAFGQDFHLNLTLEAGFIAPLYTVTILGAGGEGNLTDLSAEEETVYRHCFYKGHVNADKGYIAIISLCSGLLGTFRSSEGEYFVEPLHSYNGERYEEEHIKPHVVYRKDTREDTSSPDASGRKRGQPLPSLESTPHLTNGSGEPASHRRSKRFLSYPRFLEVMVVADSKMVVHHGQNLQHYILTLMSIVASIYKDPSIGNLISIVIVKLVLLTSELDGPTISFNAQATLKNFCVWQQGQNNLDDSHHNHHDTAILITRSEDICRARDKCDTLGLAELGTVCDPYRSCSISEDSGLSTAFTIAHELGHVFNMLHDDSNRCKEEGIKTQQHVMAPTLNYYTNPWMWSKCSRKYITEFLDTGYGECLFDEPLSSQYSLPQQLPGQIYDVNKQCELIFGPGSQVCPYMTQCRRLWCSSPEGVQSGCRTQHMPWADGTDCSPGKHCQRGLCIPKEDVVAVDGAWGVWSSFGSCSRTCGGGIKIAARDCDKPRNGGQYCVGRRLKFRSCNSEPCSKQKRDFREEQCASFDGRHFNINGLPPNVRWLPKYSGILMKDRCKLFCRVSGSTAYYQLRERVTDGTPCGPNTNDICVQGLCRQAGCDHVLNSKARRDKCGVCGGDNSSCKTVAGTLSTVHYGYNVVVHIPKGATNIDVRQHSYSGRPDDDNYLAVANGRGEYLLNGEFVVSMFKRELKVGEGVVEYSGSDHVIERLNCTDRIDEDIVIQVLSVGNLYNPDVRYSYNTPTEEKTLRFIWDAYGPWQACTRLCQGERKRKILCSRESDHLVVSDQKCQGSLRPPPVTEPCNTDCELRWHVGHKSECTATCGLGFRTVDVSCIKRSHTHKDTQKVDNQHCSSQRRPDERESCHGDCNPGVWEYSPWSECSQSCEGGRRHRSAICGNSSGNSDDSKCNSSERITEQSCSDFPCPQWKIGDWTECMVTCGRGYRHRQRWCQFREERVDERFCDAAKPESVQACQQQACASWQVGPWGQCSATCGPGYQMRAVKCVLGSYHSVIDDTECNAATRPTDTQDCEISQCSIPQTVSPETKAVSKLGHKTQWRFGSWTQCSATCGKGIPTRQVLCVNFSDQVVDVSECDPDDRPASEQECAMAQCPSRSHGNPDTHNNVLQTGRPQLHQWRIGPWGGCSSTCAGGFQRRVVVCQDENGYPAAGCDEGTRPVVQRSCESGPCPKWVHGSWGECSKSCGRGVKTRQVACQRPDGERFNDLSCDVLDKPPDQEQCNTLPCPRWTADLWSACSASCGRGYKYRNVTCVSHSGQPITEENCVHLPRPQKQRRCKGGRCLKWKTSAWGECSTSCGPGVQQQQVSCQTGDQRRTQDSECSRNEYPRFLITNASCGSGHRRRTVACLSLADEQVHNAHCAEDLRPTDVEVCNTQPCEFIWVTGEWTECSVTCGRGYRQRLVSCSEVHAGIENYEYGHQSSSGCPGTPPESYVPCILDLCPPTPTWRVGIWGPCSMSCGQGWMVRSVQCVSAEGDVSDKCPPTSRPEGQKTCSNPSCKCASIFCSAMNTDSPAEYITLTTGEQENFSEVFAFRLEDPTQCPLNLSRREDCACRRDYTASGLSTFKRVRLDLSRMAIVITDWKYAFTHEGHKVPFATAGDCYSAAQCPQGRFSLNLAGTGFQVAENTSWVSQGNYAVADVHKSQDGSRVTGTCGGYCGKCTPSSSGVFVQVT
uniref:Peptidase M12B domain-containing protein n=1 Tax=Electrophorus electricus TaxID=8005 RepID=A0A4W4GDV2_ELEEL